MLHGIAKRVGVLLLSLFVSSIIVFAVMAILPGDPARVALGVNASPDAVAKLHREFGLDRPLPVRYLDWVKGLLTLDLGKSYVTRAPIGNQLGDQTLVTMWLVGAAMVVALLIALPVGVFTAMRNGRPSGTLLSVASQIGIAIPSFLAGILLVTLFSVKLGWLPPNGWTPPKDDPVLFVKQLILPALALGLVQGAVVTRYVRSAVLEVMREDYIRTARAKGMTTTSALLRHGLRNAAIPVVTVLALQMATLLIGAVVVERVFVIPGLGSMLVDAVSNRDLVVVQDVVMLLVVAVLVVNFVVDVLYQLIDPRLRTV